MKTLKQFQEAATGYRKVKSPDEQKFIDKHEVETVPDKNGNGDEVFKASNVKKVERKKERKGYEPGEDESVYEEAEQIDELSQDKLMAYRSAAKKQGSGIQDRMKVGGGDWSKDGKDTGTLKKRMAGYKMAGRKVNPGLAATAGKAPRVAATEEFEQVDEMSSKMKMKLGLYNKKKKKMKEEADQRYTEFKESIEGLSPRLQETMYNIHDRLNEENRDKFVAACQTEEGLEKMIAFAIENRGE